MYLPVARRLRASVAQLELSLAQHKRIFEESLQRRGDELSRAVRDEVAGRENHLAGFARNLEARTVRYGTGQQSTVQ